MSSRSSPQAYIDHVAALERRLGVDQALSQAVGGEFVATGKLEYYLLRSCGLQDDHLVVDVGCGSGRLAAQLAAFSELRYVGCDVVPRLLSYAVEVCARPDWRFVHSDGIAIPCEDAGADFVCFFSVFTHLTHEEIYRYFREAHRVLKPGGRMVMSFLDLAVPSHWTTFLVGVDRLGETKHLNQFIAPPTIEAWAAHAGFDVHALHAGGVSHIPLPEEICRENGERLVGSASLGQSVAVLQKREPGRINMSSAATVSASLEPDSRSVSLVSRPAAPALLNVSTRATLPAGGAIPAGFVIGGDAARRVLVRAIGPTLTRFGITDPLAKPRLEVYSAKGLCADGFDAWGGDAKTAAIFAAVGAFPLPSDSKDSAAVLTLPPGNYSMVVKGATPLDQGTVLLEVYLVD